MYQRSRKSICSLRRLPFHDRVMERIENLQIEGHRPWGSWSRWARASPRCSPSTSACSPSSSPWTTCCSTCSSFALGSLVDVVVAVVCFVLANRPSSWESGKPITLEGKLLPHRAGRVIDLFFQLPTMLAYNLKRQKLILELGNRHLLGKQGRLGTWVRSDIEYLYLMTWDQATYSVFI